MTQNKFPTEIIDLPSKGHFYPEDNPLSSGKIEMRYMTARDEDILTSANLIQQGKALDKLLESLIIDKTIDYNDILVGDKNAVLVGARVLAYGKNYDFSNLGIDFAMPAMFIGLLLPLILTRVHIAVCLAAVLATIILYNLGFSYWTTLTASVISILLGLWLYKWNKI